MRACGLVRKFDLRVRLIACVMCAAVLVCVFIAILKMPAKDGLRALNVALAGFVFLLVWLFVVRQRRLAKAMRARLAEASIACARLNALSDDLETQILGGRLTARPEEDARSASAVLHARDAPPRH